MSVVTIIELLLGVSAAIVLAYAFLVEPYRISITRVDIHLPNLPKGLEGLSICHLSDLHVTNYGNFEKRLERILSNLNVDIGLITGDIVDGYGHSDHVKRVLRGFKPRLGVYAVPGNGEWGLRIPFAWLMKELSDCGILYLVNEHISIYEKSENLHIIGVDDPFTARDDLNRAVSGIDEPGLRILLAHSPDIFEHISDHRIDLVLAGHTHGGQIRFPWIGPLWLHCRYHLGISSGYFSPERLGTHIKGVYQNMHAYVSRGLGNSGVHARLLCAPEIVILVLRT